MDPVRLFGSIVGSQTEKNPERGRAIMLAGWRAQLWNLRHNPDRRLPPARQYAAVVAMDKIVHALRDGEHAAFLSVFAPSEPLVAAGIVPYSVEQMSCFLAGTKCEQTFLDRAGDAGFSPTMCSYHRTFLGAVTSGLAPTPAFSVYTNLACDGNMITFPYLERTLHVPTFLVEVPYERSEDAVHYVADQVRALCGFIGDVTGRAVSEDALADAVARGNRSLASYRRFLTASPGRRLPADMTTEMYGFMMNHMLLGTPETERFCRDLADEMEQAPASEGLRLMWIHTMPFSQPAAIERLNFSDRAFICACDFSADPALIDVDPAKPFEAIARRMVYSCYNGSAENRVRSALRLAEMTHADGAVLFNHWGCKVTIGASTLIKRKLEDAGLPCLVLDGDGVDETNRSDGQTATRLDAFLELLEGRRS